jgi:hypothetical protein
MLDAESVGSGRVCAAGNMSCPVGVTALLQGTKYTALGNLLRNGYEYFGVLSTEYRSWWEARLTPRARSTCGRVCGLTDASGWVEGRMPRASREEPCL